MRRTLCFQTLVSWRSLLVPRFYTRSYFFLGGLPVQCSVSSQNSFLKSSRSTTLLEIRTSSLHKRGSGGTREQSHKMSFHSAATMANPDSLESRTAAMKVRIVTHMNDDHAFSLQLFLRQFCAVPEQQVSNAKLTDFALDHMVIESSAGRNVVPIDPPMVSFSEARGRMVTLHQHALTGLNLSETKIDSWALPNKIWQIITIAVATWCFATFPFRSRLLPESGSFISTVWSLGGFAPGLARLAFTLSPVTFVFMIVVHGAETENFARTRLRKHQVPIGTVVWWAWLVNTFLGGVASFNRFDDLVNETEAAIKKGGKH